MLTAGVPFLGLALTIIKFRVDAPFAPSFVHKSERFNIVGILAFVVSFFYPLVKDIS
jgi:hypothetical protein